MQAFAEFKAGDAIITNIDIRDRAASRTFPAGSRGVVISRTWDMSTLRIKMADSTFEHDAKTGDISAPVTFMTPYRVKSV